MELLTQFCLVSRWHMLLFLKLVLTVGEGTGWTVGATLGLDPALAEFSLDFELIVS